MKKLAAGVALVALIPVCAVTTAALVALDLVVTLRDLRRSDRAGKFGWVFDLETKFDRIDRSRR